MSKTIRRLLCLAMSIALVVTMNVWVGSPVSAETAQPRFSYTNYTKSSLSFTTSGGASCIAAVEGYPGTTTKVYIEMRLQQYIALQWTTIGSWQLTRSDFYGSLSKTKALTSSGNYRVKANFTVYSGSAYEKIETISPEKYYTRP